MSGFDISDVNLSGIESLIKERDRKECERPDWCPLLKEEGCVTQK